MANIEPLLLQANLLGAQLDPPVSFEAQPCGNGLTMEIRCRRDGKEFAAELVYTDPAICPADLIERMTKVRLFDMLAAAVILD